MRSPDCDVVTSPRPWSSIDASLVELPVVRTGYREAQSPCASCPTSPCCTYLPLHSFRVTSLVELDHAVYLLNFDRIELGLSGDGDWTVAYREPCRHLDRSDMSCGVHGRDEQPQVCVTYNPHSCWYRRVLTSSSTDDHLRIDRRRLEAIIDLLVFDGDGTLVDAPDWPTLTEAVADVAPEPTPPPAAPEPDGDPRRGPPAGPGPGEGRRTLPLAVGDLADPCDGCDAWCCTTLVFPHPAPATRSNLDYVRFCLGFPGIEMGITDQGWSLVVRTRCRHLEGTRCGVYGRDERPLLCTYYDQWQCTYRVHFGQKRPPGYVRVTYDDWDALADCFRFDDAGNVVEFLTTEDVRTRIGQGSPTAAAAR